MSHGPSRLPIQRLAAELVVIVAGVLIALAVDDWRERRSESALARHLLESVADDLRADVAELESVLADARSVTESSDRLLNRMSQPGMEEPVTADPSVLAADVTSVIGGIDFDLSDVAYREMMSTGSSQVLPNDLRREIAQYYWLVQSFNVTYSDFEEHRTGLQRALVRLGVAPRRPEGPRLEAAVADPEVRALVAELGARAETMEVAHQRFLVAATTLLAKTQGHLGAVR